MELKKSVVIGFDIRDEDRECFGVYFNIIELRADHGVKREATTTNRVLCKPWLLNIKTEQFIKEQRRNQRGDY